MDLAPLWMRGLTPLGMKKAKDELGETSEHKQKCLEKLKKLIEGEYDVESMGAEALIATGMATCEIGMETEMSQVCGSQVIIDYQGMTFTKMSHFSSITLLSKLVRGLQDCLPYRVAAIHNTHEPAYYGMLYSIVKPMLSRKLRNRMHFHGRNMESLHKFIPPEALPKSLGGILSEKDIFNTKSAIYENEHISANINKYIFQGVKSPKYDSNLADSDHTLIIPKELQLAY